MVMTRVFETWANGTRHEFTGSPSMSTVHAPHSPSPHPSLVPVRPQSSRSTSSRRFIGCAATRVRLPFRTNCVIGGTFFGDTEIATEAQSHRAEGVRRGAESGG